MVASMAIGKPTSARTTLISISNGSSRNWQTGWSLRNQTLLGCEVGYGVLHVVQGLLKGVDYFQAHERRPIHKVLQRPATASRRR